MWWNKSKKSVSKVFIAVGALVVALGIVACSSVDGESSDPGSPMTTPMPEVTSTPTPTPGSMKTPTTEATATPMASETVVDIAVADGRFTTLVTALEAAGLVETLEGEGPFTVFAPTNEAFAALPEGTVEDLLEDKEALRNVLQYHVVSGRVLAAEVTELDSVETVQGSTASVRVENGNVYINDAQVIVTDIQASNGVIHVIDAVLLPESPTIVDVAVKDSRFTTLVTALEAAGLVRTLQGEGPFTVFAPTDEAFAALPEGTIEALLADKEKLRNVLLYHVVEGQVMANQVVGLDSAETLQGQHVDIRVEGRNVYVNDAQVVITDIEASNGVIHVIDTVLMPEPKTIVDIALEDGRFTSLVTALQATGLDKKLEGEGPFTVFAPTDEAFAALPEGTLEGLLADTDALCDILQYHVVNGRVTATEVIELDTVETVQGSTAPVRVENGNVYINEARVIVTDIQASNGIIHVIDAVILPPSNS